MVVKSDLKRVSIRIRLKENDKDSSNAHSTLNDKWEEFLGLGLDDHMLSLSPLLMINSCTYDSKIFKENNLVDIVIAFKSSEISESITRKLFFSNNQLSFDGWKADLEGFFIDSYEDNINVQIPDNIVVKCKLQILSPIHFDPIELSKKKTISIPSLTDLVNGVKVRASYFDIDYSKIGEVEKMDSLKTHPFTYFNIRSVKTNKGLGICGKLEFLLHSYDCNIIQSLKLSQIIGVGAYPRKGYGIVNFSYEFLEKEENP